MISNLMKQYVEQSSPIRAMFEEGKRLSEIYGKENVFDFSLGNPNVEPPESVKNSIIEILNSETPTYVHGYMNNSGYEDVRKSISSNLNEKYGTNLTEESIVMTCGAAGGLNVIFKTLLNEGDEVIIFAPFFGEYKFYVANYGGVIKVVSPDLNTFEPNLKEFEDKITKRTKAVIINTPNNPTGVVYSSDTIKKMADIMNKKSAEFGTSIYLISDEPYREISYDGVEVPYIINYYKNSFIGYSYSKSLSLPGERIGYIAANNDMDDFHNVMEGLKVATRILGFVNAPSLFQRVISKNLNSEVDVKIYEKNRDLLYNHLTSIGFECVKPNGAFYLFPKSPIEDDKEFCNIAKEYNVLIVPGSSFGCPGYFRAAYCISYDTIERSLPSFTKIMERVTR